jgi:hypothetical protein
MVPSNSPFQHVGLNPSRRRLTYSPCPDGKLGHGGVDELEESRGFHPRSLGYCGFESRRLCSYDIRIMQRPHRLAVRTPDSQSDNGSSTLLGATWTMRRFGILHLPVKQTRNILPRHLVLVHHSLYAFRNSSMAERLTVNQDVEGSSPSFGAIHHLGQHIYGT